jgi:hypothetical protein
MIAPLQPCSARRGQGGPAACDLQEDQSAQAGCTAQWEAFNTCGAANLDLACETNQTCSAEALAWSDCLDAAGL